MTNTDSSFSFEQSSGDKLTAKVDDQSYQVLLQRLKMCAEAEALLRPDLLNFNCYVVHNIGWYYNRLESEFWARIAWFIVSGLTTVALPVVVYFIELKLNPSSFSLASALLALILAWYRTMNAYLANRRVTTGYRAAASSLKEILYEFESKWTEVLNSSVRASILANDCQTDLRDLVLEARKIVANEQFEFFDTNKPVLIDLPANQPIMRNTATRINFLSDSTTQPAANFRFVGFTHQEESAVLSAHLVAYQTIAGCKSMNDEEKRNLRDTYSKSIVHHKITGRDYGQAEQHGSFLGVNLDKLLDSLTPSNELPQTLIHEMMHCAGYGHPEKGPNDSPGDGDGYFNSPPLRAELCIAGLQSDDSGKPNIELYRPVCSKDPIDGSFRLF